MTRDVMALVTKLLGSYEGAIVARMKSRPLADVLAAVARALGARDDRDAQSDARALREVAEVVSAHGLTWADIDGN